MMTTSQRNEKQVAGPELPPGFLQQSSNKASEPAFVGPALPPGFQRETEESVLPVTGPALPPGFKPVKRPVIGPALPACAEEADDRCEPLPADATGATSGGGGGAFKRHHSDSDDDDGDVIGPMLPSHPQVEYSAAEEFDMRAKKMKEKIRKENEVVVTERETWMTELPAETSKSHSLLMGLAPRTFRKDGGAEKAGDRSDWTDTPSDRIRKQNESAEGKVPRSSRGKSPPTISTRDQYLAEQVTKHNKSVRSESLVELHNKKLKREEKKKLKSGEVKPEAKRKPFNREEDLQVNKFDDAQKKQLIKKSQLLNSRFSHGGTGTQFL